MNRDSNAGGGAELRIRVAQPRDRALIRAFHRALYVTHRDEVVPPNVIELHAYRDLDEALDEDVDALYARGAAILIAERGDAQIGYITGHVEDDPRRVLERRGVIEDWYVAPDARGSGVGRLLFETLSEVFREAGCVVIESGTWGANAGARRVHEALGFHEIEIRYRKRMPPPLT